VVATTGLSTEQTDMLKSDLSQRIPVFFSANMSLGVNLLIDLVKKAAKVLEGHFDIEIVEKHHNQKIDAPSGTALAIADAINDTLDEKCEYTYDRHSRRKKRSKQEIGIHAVRGGTIVGDHSVIFAGNDEIIEINHTANSKEIFGVGALKAALFLSSKAPGLYSMTDLIEEIN
jgi:4-hydroxy-tetrahydrodipicolinate reductase